MAQNTNRNFFLKGDFVLGLVISFTYLFIYLSIYLFIYGCVGSLLLRAGERGLLFSSLQWLLLLVEHRL